MIIHYKSNYDFWTNYGESAKELNVYIDNKVFEQETDKAKNAIALMVEPRSIYPTVYAWLEENYNLFEVVFTFDSKLLKLPNAKLLLYGQITAEYPHVVKTKSISMVASNKSECEGHLQRKAVARILKPYIDTYGTFDGGAFCDDSDYLAKYMFNVAMENYSDGAYFTEKICNCFASKVVPIYWGCPIIGDYFDTDGIIICQTPDEVVNNVLSILTDPVKEYEKRKNAIEANFWKVKEYRNYQDWFFKEYGEWLETKIK